MQCCFTCSPPPTLTTWPLTALSQSSECLLGQVQPFWYSLQGLCYLSRAIVSTLTWFYSPSFPTTPQPVLSHLHFLAVSVLDSVSQTGCQAQLLFGSLPSFSQSKGILPSSPIMTAYLFLSYRLSTFLQMCLTSLT